MTRTKGTIRRNEQLAPHIHSTQVCISGSCRCVRAAGLERCANQSMAVDRRSPFLSVAIVKDDGDDELVAVTTEVLAEDDNEDNT